ncbi:MAG: D-aminoacyl-tRNA deacylase [Treponema sp.]|nr:D-aminoacyl-tRNA deacylase [Treponema sp.]
MKTVIQRVSNAQVSVDDIVKGRIKYGLLVYLGVGHEDTEKDADWLAEKTVNLRVFSDENDKMNLSIIDMVNHVNTSVNENAPSIGVLAVSQFTLMGDARKGRRPSWDKAAPPEKANKLYDYFTQKIRGYGLLCETGEFQAHMMVTYTNDGPVTILLDSKEDSGSQ